MMKRDARGVRIQQNSFDITAPETIDIEEDEHSSPTPTKANDDDSSGVSKVAYFIGVMYVVMASTALSLQNCWVKFAKKEGFQPFQMLLGRGIIQLFFTAMIDVYDYCSCTNSVRKNPETHHDEQEKTKSRNLHPQNKTDWMYVVIRGALGFLTAYGNYTAQTMIPQGDASAIFATFPIWTVLLAAFFLKEKIKIYHVIAMVLGITGVVLIAQPPVFFGQKKNGQQYNYFGVAISLSASFVNGFAFLVLRKLKHIRATYSVYGYSIGAMAGSLLMSFGGTWKAIDFSSWYQPTLLFTLGFFGFAGQYLKTKSLQFIPAGVASLVRTTDVLFNYILGLLFLGELPNTFAIVGAVLVALPIIIISLAKIHGEKQKQSLQKV